MFGSEWRASHSGSGNGMQLVVTWTNRGTAAKGGSRRDQARRARAAAASWCLCSARRSKPAKTARPKDLRCETRGSVAEASETLAFGAALGFALLLADALAFAALLILVVARDDADALAQRSVLGVRGVLLATR